MCEKYSVCKVSSSWGPVFPAPSKILFGWEREDILQEPSGLVTWITGPSRTADIEKVLVLGAQGASELIVIVYQEE